MRGRTGEGMKRRGEERERRRGKGLKRRGDGNINMWQIKTKRTHTVRNHAKNKRRKQQQTKKERKTKKNRK